MGPDYQHYFVLVGQTAVPVDDVLEWARFFEDHANRIVRQEYVWPFWVSTVFLGLNHSFRFGPPEIFETMVFHGGKGDLICLRCATWSEAEEQHRQTVRLVRLWRWLPWKVLPAIPGAIAAWELDWDQRFQERYGKPLALQERMER